MIIKGLFGNNDDDTTQKKAELVKFCSICQESMKEDNGDNHCKDCDDKGHHKQASFWKSHYAAKKANQLSPQMQKLADKLAANKQSLLEGRGISRQDGFVQDRNISAIQKASVAGKQVDFSVVKQQVANILPTVLAELGLKDKVDANLLVDLMVPMKIASPIGNVELGKAAIRTIVCEVVAYTNPELVKEAGIKTHGKVASFDASTMHVLDEGIRRVSNDYNSRSRSLSQIAAENDAADKAEAEEKPEASEESDYAPKEVSDSQNAGGVDVAESEKLNNAETAKVSDDEAESFMKGDEPNHEAGLNESSVKRIQQNHSSASRNLSKIASENDKVKKNNILKFASTVNAYLPVETVKLSNQDREVIASYPALETFVANFTDSGTLSWNCYKTNKGYLALSEKTAFHAKDLKSFAKFVQADGTFANWNQVPEEAQDNYPDVDSTLSDIPDADGKSVEVYVMTPPDISVCDCENGHSSPEAHDNEEQLFNLIMELLPQVQEMFPNDDEEMQNDLAMTAALDILEASLNKEAMDGPTPSMNDMIKNVQREEHGLEPEEDKKPPFGLDATAADSPNPLLNELGKNVNKGIDSFVKKHPKTEPFAKAVKPYTNVGGKPSSGPGNALFDEVAKPVNKMMGVTSSVLIPGDKQKHINQIVAQLYKTKDEEGSINLMASLHKVTPHLNDSQRKSLLPVSFHQLHDDVMSVIASEDNKEDESNDDESMEKLIKATANLSDSDFEISVEALLEMGYSEASILAVAEHRFSEKDDRQQKHIEKSEEDSGKSKKEAEDIGWATVQKLKNQK